MGAGMTEPEPIRKGSFPEPLLSAEERDTVFQVWAMLADRSPTETVKIAKRDHGFVLRPATISSWANRYSWTMRARELYQDIAPGMMERGRANLVGAVPAATMYLQRVADGREKADRDRINACNSILDRTGYLPHTRRDVEKGGGTPITASRDGDPLELMTDAELRAIASGRLVDGAER